MEQTIKNSTSLLKIKGTQDKNISQQIIRPILLDIPKYYPYKPIDLMKFECDAIKIKGFIFDKTKINELVLNRSYLEIIFGGDPYYKIPFDFLISFGLKKTNDNDDTNCFIEFPHDYFFGYPLRIFNNFYNTLEIRLGSDSSERDFDIKILLEACFYDHTYLNIFNIANYDSSIKKNQLVDIRQDTNTLTNSTPLDISKCKISNTNTNTIKYDIRNIESFELAKSVKNPNMFENTIEPNFLTQGIFIDTQLENIQSIKVILYIFSSDDIITGMDYGLDLVKIYGKQVSQLTYFGFNPNESFFSNNLVGCINMSKIDKVYVEVKLKDSNHIDKLPVYLANWNELIYSQGLFLIRYSK